MLRKFKSLLAPGGAVLLDVYTETFFNQSEEKALYEVNQLNQFWSPDKYYGFMNTFKYEAEKVILDKFEIIEKSRTRTVYNWLQCFSRQSVVKEFTDNGLKVRDVYANVAGAPFDAGASEMAIVAINE
jgi:hypothetical protein